jgi:hypothetical protein
MILWSLPRSLDAPETKKTTGREQMRDRERGSREWRQGEKKKKGNTEKGKNWKGGKYLFLYKFVILVL